MHRKRHPAHRKLRRKNKTRQMSQVLGFAWENALNTRNDDIKSAYKQTTKYPKRNYKHKYGSVQADSTGIHSRGTCSHGGCSVQPWRPGNLPEKQLVFRAINPAILQTKFWRYTSTIYVLFCFNYYVNFKSKLIAQGQVTSLLMGVPSLGINYESWFR